ncbi:hypothetical protein MLD38_008084 [Melastoma candidum]|uniref:Uncharacterized protein n=1 Tax=Melastoma candidum TaxID=119954 RepID=A0ACB9RSS5_9MYRT|nr:hypothetical protein MLD38_008084 [Melastoma candidum]
MGDGTLGEGISVAAPFIFSVVLAFHFFSWYLCRSIKKGSNSDEDAQIRGEIKQLLKQASSLSQPSTFAQAAKLRRLAASKEKELMRKQETVGQDIKDSLDSQQRLLLIIKAITYFILVCWFWRTPVTSVSRHLLQPFGKLLSWGTGSPLSDYVMVGIIPWLVLCTRVSKLVFRHLK